MNLSHRACLFLVLGLVFGLGRVSAQDHLEPEVHYPGSERYAADIQQVFAQGYASDVILRVLEAPALGVEEVAGIRATKSGYEAFVVSLVTLNSSVSELGFVRKIKAGEVKGVAPDGTIKGEEHSPYVRVVQETPTSASEFKTKTDAAAISPALAKRIAALWQKMVLDARAPTEIREGFDGVSYLFSSVVEGRGSITAEIWSPQTESKTGRLVSLGEALAKFARNEISEDKVAEAMAALEQ